MTLITVYIVARTFLSAPKSLGGNAAMLITLWHCTTIKCC